MSDQPEPPVHQTAPRVYRENLVERISALTESVHTQLAVKLLKQHNLVPEGTDPADIAKGIQKRHGVPAVLVPQMIHYAGIRLRDQDAHEKRRLEHAAAKRNDPEFDKSPLARIWKGRHLTRSDHLKSYAAYAKDPGVAYQLNSESTAELPSHLEAAADTARSWHAIATHPKKSVVVTHGYLDAMHGASSRSDEVAAQETPRLLGIPAVSVLHDEKSRAAVHSASMFGFDGGASARVSNNELHASFHDMHARAAAYNPLKQETWAPHYALGVTPTRYTTDAHDIAPMPGTDAERYASHSRLGLFQHTVDHVNARKGITPAIPHSAEHTVGGEHFRAYTLDTPEKANAGCWGHHFCISTGASADSMNRHYHGGDYKPVHLITRVSKGEDGKPVEKVHAAYLPELLPGQKHEDPEQAVRNSGNNGAVTGDAFKKIHPLLTKLDPRIDGVAAHYHEA